MISDEFTIAMEWRALDALLGANLAVMDQLTLNSSLNLLRHSRGVVELDERKPHPSQRLAPLTAHIACFGFRQGVDLLGALKTGEWRVRTSYRDMPTGACMLCDKKLRDESPWRIVDANDHG